MNNDIQVIGCSIMSKYCIKIKSGEGILGMIKQCSQDVAWRFFLEDFFSFAIFFSFFVLRIECLFHKLKHWLSYLTEVWGFQYWSWILLQTYEAVWLSHWPIRHWDFCKSNEVETNLLIFRCKTDQLDQEWPQHQNVWKIRKIIKQCFK